MSTFTDRINQFNKQIAALGTKITGLADKRKSFSLAASEGDTHARKEIADVDFELEGLRKEAMALSSALETAEALAKQEALDQQQKAERDRAVEAARHAEAVAALNVELDDRLRQLRDVFERRAGLLAALGNFNILDPSLLMRMSGKSGPTSAAQFVGLGRYLALEMVPAHVMRPLTDGNDPLLGIAKKVSPPAPNRTPRLNNGGNNSRGVV
jgi:hypothetical protein